MAVSRQQSNRKRKRNQANKFASVGDPTRLPAVCIEVWDQIVFISSPDQRTNEKKTLSRLISFRIGTGRFFSVHLVGKHDRERDEPAEGEEDNRRAWSGSLFSTKRVFPRKTMNELISGSMQRRYAHGWFLDIVQLSIRKRTAAIAAAEAASLNRPIRVRLTVPSPFNYRQQLKSPFAMGNSGKELSRIKVRETASTPTTNGKETIGPWTTWGARDLFPTADLEIRRKRGEKKKMNLSLVLSLLIPSLTGILKNGYISSDKEGIGRRQLLFFGIDSDGPWLVWDLQSRGPDFMLRNDNGRSARIRGREA